MNADWEGIITECFEDNCITATEEQINDVIECVEGTINFLEEEKAQHYFGCSENEEVEKLKKKLKREEGKMVCPECKGQGYERSFGPTHYSDHDCHKCRGKGFVY